MSDFFFFKIASWKTLEQVHVPLSSVTLCLFTIHHFAIGHRKQRDIEWKPAFHNVFFLLISISPLSSLSLHSLTLAIYSSLLCTAGRGDRRSIASAATTRDSTHHNTTFVRERHHYYANGHRTAAGDGCTARFAGEEQNRTELFVACHKWM
jgi:hypothetical protein